jgi:hypothetical protein
MVYIIFDMKSGLTDNERRERAAAYVVLSASCGERSVMAMPKPVYAHMPTHSFLNVVDVARAHASRISYRALHRIWRRGIRWALPGR